MPHQIAHIVPLIGACAHTSPSIRYWLTDGQAAVIFHDARSRGVFLASRKLEAGIALFGVCYIICMWQFRIDSGGTLQCYNRIKSHEFVIYEPHQSDQSHKGAKTDTACGYMHRRHPAFQGSEEERKRETERGEGRYRVRTVFIWYSCIIFHVRNPTDTLRLTLSTVLHARVICVTRSTYIRDYTWHITTRRA